MVARATYPVSLDSNENPFGPSSHAVEAMVAEASNSARYSEDVSELLRAQIAQREGVEPGQIIFGLGGGQALEMFALYLSDAVGLADGARLSAAPLPTSGLSSLWNATAVSLSRSRQTPRSSTTSKPWRQWLDRARAASTSAIRTSSSLVSTS